MELLYLIDRMLTSILQIFTKFVEKKFHVGISVQRLILLFVGSYLGSSWAESLNVNFHADLWYIVDIFLIAFCWTFITVPMEFVLHRLHVFFDYEGAYATDKLYENGYKAWSGVVITAAYLVIGFSLHQEISYPLITQGIAMLLYVSYFDFVSRRKGPGKKRQRKMSEALQALLERCRDFIPAPQPVPVRVRAFTLIDK